jgi:hypothetical protein
MPIQQIKSKLNHVKNRGQWCSFCIGQYRSSVIAHWIVKRLWIDSGKITKVHLELMEKRAKNIKVPADLGRIPHKIATGEGFSGYTADQWKSFIMVYAIPISVSNTVSILRR